MRPPGMNPKAIFGVRAREQCRTLEGIELYINLIELRISRSEKVAFINGSSLDIVQNNDDVQTTRSTILPCDLRLAAPGPLGDIP